MTDPITVLPGMAKRIGFAADHGGLELKQELVETFLAVRFSGAERHRRRLAKVLELEN